MPLDALCLSFLLRHIKWMLNRASIGIIPVARAGCDPKLFGSRFWRFASQERFLRRVWFGSALQGFESHACTQTKSSEAIKHMQRVSCDQAACFWTRRCHATVQDSPFLDRQRSNCKDFKVRLHRPCTGGSRQANGSIVQLDFRVLRCF